MQYIQRCTSAQLCAYNFSYIYQKPLRYSSRPCTKLFSKYVKIIFLLKALHLILPCFYHDFFKVYAVAICWHCLYCIKGYNNNNTRTYSFLCVLIHIYFKKQFTHSMLCVSTGLKLPFKCPSYKSVDKSDNFRPYLQT